MSTCVHKKSSRCFPLLLSKFFWHRFSPCKATILARLVCQQTPEIHLFLPLILGLWQVQHAGLVCGCFVFNLRSSCLHSKYSYSESPLLLFLFIFIIIIWDRTLLWSPAIHYVDHAGLKLYMILLLLCFLSAEITGMSELLCLARSNNSPRYFNLCSHDSVHNLSLLQPKHGKTQLTLTRPLKMKQKYIITVPR